MPTQATHRIAFGESDAEAPAGLHTKELAGSHDCELLGAPTGQSSTASCEAKADRALPVTISNRKVTKTMTIDALDNLAPGEDGVQEQNSCPKTTPTGSNVVAASCDLSPVIDGNIESTTPVSPETKAGATFATPANTAPPDENEQVCSPQAEPTSVLSSDSSHGEDETSIPSDSITPSVPAGRCIHMNVRGDETTNNTTNTMSTNNDIPTVPADDESAATQMNNATAADVESATGSSTTNNSAAALASANLNSGTDCATTSDTTMNKSYTTKCSVVRHNKPSFNVIAPMSDEPQMITLSYSKGHPSSSGDVHPSINRQCYHDGNTIVSASGSVDDSVSISAPGLDYTSSSGATHSFGAMGTSVPAGYYDVSVTHSNIQSHPAGNVSVLTGSVGPVQFRTIVPDENEEVVCDECTGSCKLTSTTDGGSQPGSTRAVENITIVPFTSSSGGSGVVRTANARHMRFAFAFGSFRGMGNVPSGQPEIVAFNYDASLLTPAALTYKHPLASVLVPEGDSVDANEGFRIFDGAAYANYIVSGDGSKAFAVGATSKKSEVVRFVSAISKDDSVVCNLSDASYVRVSSADDSAVFYYLNGENKNEFAAYISPDGATIEADEKLSIIRDTETGIIRQIWNYWDGLADVVPATEGNGYTISLYLPSQLTAPVEDGQLFTFAGDPFKTFTISGDAETQSMTIRERDWSLPENTPDYVTTWTHSEAGWNKVIGEEDDVISETRVKSPIEDSDDYQIVTTVSKGGVVASCVCEVFTSSVNGELCISRTEAYGSDIAQTTTFEYDEAGREVKRVAHHGGVYETVYDKYGRVTVESSPWAGGQKQLTSTIYREANSYNSDPAKVVQSVVSATGGVTDLRTNTYTYTETDGVRRVEINSTAAGSSFTQNEVEETWLSTAENVYARGRVKMRQEVNGVQTHFEYAATAEHNALYTVTSETRVNGVTVAGQSRRMVEFISAAGNTIRKEEYALLADGETWALLSGVTNTYDVKNRLVGTLKDNGRSTTRTLNCSGQVLTETDEDGVTTTYGYNTARQLVEVIREEIKDSDVVVTPETITTYTHDAVGRTLSVRKDIGAMSVTEYTEYDLLGRTIRKEDLLGRVTITNYSADGLTSTVTTPAGATFITVHNTDGSTARVAGSGQRALIYVHDLSGSNRRMTTKLADNTIIAQTIVDGFDQTIVEAKPNTLNGFIYNRYEFNEKGQMTKSYRDTGWNTPKTAVTIYEFDSIGNIMKQTLVLDDTAPSDVTKNRIVLQSNFVEMGEDGIYAVTNMTRYSAEGNALVTSRKNLISQVSLLIESKTIEVDVRGNISIHWTEYSTGSKRISKSTIPTSNVTAMSVSVDGFNITQTDYHGVCVEEARIYNAQGVVTTYTDARGNTNVITTDKAGRMLTNLDGAGNVTTTVYDDNHNLPILITDAFGKTTCYKYDIRGRKVAEYGTAIHPALFSYDDDDRMISLTTFRSKDEEIIEDPSERGDGDVTTWTYHTATGLEVNKAFADGSRITKTYNLYGQLISITNARGIMQIHEYDEKTELLRSISFNDSTPSQTFQYNVQGQPIQITDAAGVHSFSYNEYGEQISDGVTVNSTAFSLEESYDNYGRCIGYTLHRGESGNAQVVTYGYDSIGNLSSTAFMMGNSFKSFTYNRSSNTNLLSSIVGPNGITRYYEYEEHRDFIISINDKRGETAVVNRSCSYDKLGRQTSSSYARQGTVRNDTFIHNDNSELSFAEIGEDEFSYLYDNIGNRKNSTEKNIAINYISNSLNQYTSVNDFEPEFDADGNQTLVKTATGIWAVTYNALNRPVVFMRTNDDGTQTCVSADYDFMGRRIFKKVETIIPATVETTEIRTVVSHQRYLYRDYLQIAAIDLTRSTLNALWYITWDPNEPIATRPLAIQKNGTWFTYGIDIAKNVSELYGADGYIKSAYTYTPFGSVISSGNVEQPIQWSSEFYDDELAMVYYNYRYYCPEYSAWISRDPEETTYAKYNFLHNMYAMNDFLGLAIEWHHVFPKGVYNLIKKMTNCEFNIDINGLDNGVYLCKDEHDFIHNKEKWNKQLEEAFKNIAKSCCETIKNWILEEMRKRKDFLKEYRGGVDVDKRHGNHYHAEDRIEIGNPAKDPCKKKSRRNISYEEAQKIAEREAEKELVEDTQPWGIPVMVPSAGKAAAFLAKKALKFGLKKIPVVGWGYAAWGAYQGYRTGGLAGAICGALF